MLFRENWYILCNKAKMFPFLVVTKLPSSFVKMTLLEQLHTKVSILKYTLTAEI